MSENMTRRNWLKISGLAGSALAFSSCGSLPQTELHNVLSKTPVRLFANENPYGFSPKAKQAIIESVEIGNQYADAERVSQLEKMIAKREGLSQENVILGSGSGEVLCMAGAAFGWQSGEIVVPNPTFPMLYRYAANFGAKIDKVPLSNKHKHDLNAMERRITGRTSLCYVCNPNNPTGTIVSTEKVKSFCEEASRKTTVFVDEAYLEYTEEFPRNSMVELVKRNANVIVSRTFSKIYGMAGMRIGYGLAKAEIVEKLKRFRMTWFNSLGINAAIAAYRDQEFITQSQAKNKKVREYLYREFTNLKMTYAESHGNFIWVNVGEKNRGLDEKMRPSNLLVRNAQTPFEDWARITIGTAEQMNTFIKAFRQT